MRQIKTKGSPILHQISEPVSYRENLGNMIGFDLIRDMFLTLDLHKGIGLAAPQLGMSKRVIVIHTDDFKQAFINPIITRRFGGTKTSREGCLSYPGLTASVTRYKRIIVEGYDQDWKPIRRKLKGIAAICVQHEVDHLNGITIG